MTTFLMNRREALKTGAAIGLAGAGAALGACASNRSSTGAGGRASRAPRRAIRVAHLTDIHVQPERRAGEGLAACLKHVQEQPDRPQLILTGGDLIMDGFAQDEARTKIQWDMFTGAFRHGCSLRVEHTLGNHDIWGWNKGDSRTTGDEPRWGKKWAVEVLGLPERYRSFNLAGWHFIILDSTHPDPRDPNGYIAKLDEAQWDWLQRDLESVAASDAAARRSTPVLIVSHIPIISATAFFYGRDPEALDKQVSGGLMHVDAAKLRALFLKHRNVKLCLSGHMHEIDRVELEGVTYLCNGAVSGSWWKGRHRQCDEGYAVLDLFDDGSHRCEYVKYGWEAAPA